jgi:Ca2+-binding EF-hand superfamily protein
MITKDDMNQVIDFGKYYGILPFRDKTKLKKYLSRKKAKVLKEGFSYNSKDNRSFLNLNEIRKILKKEKFI